jgi:hypothetical protein
VHGLAAAALNLVYAEGGAKMAAQPFDARPIGHVAARDEEIAAAAHEVGGVEHRLEFVDHEALRFARLGHAIRVIVQFIA